MGPRPSRWRRCCPSATPPIRPLSLHFDPPVGGSERASGGRSVRLGVGGCVWGRHSRAGVSRARPWPSALIRPRSPLRPAPLGADPAPGAPTPLPALRPVSGRVGAWVWGSEGASGGRSVCLRAAARATWSSTSSRRAPCCSHIRGPPSVTARLRCCTRSRCGALPWTGSTSPDRIAGGRRRNQVVTHCSQLHPSESMVIDALAVTTVPRTLVAPASRPRPSPRSTPARGRCGPAP